MLSKEQKDLYNKYYNSAKNNTVLDPKTTLLIHLAVSMTIGCYP